MSAETAATFYFSFMRGAIRWLGWPGLGGSAVSAAGVGIKTVSVSASAAWQCCPRSPAVLAVPVTGGRLTTALSRERLPRTCPGWIRVGGKETRQ